MKRRANGPTAAARDARRLKRAHDVAAWAASPTDLDSAVAASSLVSLPPFLLSDRVFSFLAPPPSLETPSTLRDGINTRQYESQLSTLRLVCQRWNRATQQLLHERENAQFKIRFSTANANDRARILRDAQAHGQAVEELEIVTGTYSGMMWNFTTGKYFCKDELMNATA